MYLKRETERDRVDVPRWRNGRGQNRVTGINAIKTHDVHV